MKSLHANYQYLLPGVCLILLGCTAPQTRTPSVDSASSQEEARKQREMVLEDYMNADRKLQSVAAKIIVSGAELCGTKIGPYFGISVWTQDQFQKEWKQTVQSRFNLTEQVHLSNVVAGSTADLAGLKQDDVIVSVNQWLPPGLHPLY